MAAKVVKGTGGRRRMASAAVETGPARARVGREDAAAARARVAAAAAAAAPLLLLLLIRARDSSSS
jgi:hypothetical protein